jgi:SecD/SecF fusion protein
MRSFTWKIVLCVGLVVLSLVVNGLAAYWYMTNGGGFKLGVDLVGGTILVYEVDKDKFADARAQKEFEDRSQQLAASLKHRIDPADLYNVTIRQVGTWRVEIILPTGGQHQAEIEARAWQDLLNKVRDHYQLPDARFEDVAAGEDATLVDQVYKLLEQQNRPETREDISAFVHANYKVRALTSEEVEKVKETISRVGSLEFRILANDHDDKRALELARQYFERAQKGDGPERRALTDAAITNRPPPPPLDNGNPFIDTATGLGQFTYSWVELGRLERATMGLDNASEGGMVEENGKKVWRPLTTFGAAQGLSDTQLNQRRKNLMWHEVAVARGDEKVATEPTKDGQVNRFVKTGTENWKKLLDEARRQYGLAANADLNVPRDQTEALATRVHELLPKDKREANPVPGILKFIDEHYQTESFQLYPLQNMGGVPLYSRRVLNPSRLPKEEQDKKVEYFVLTRDPQKGKEVTGLYLQGAKRGVDNQQRPCVQFTFNQVGGDRFYDLTSQNAPTRDGFHRFLAVVLDGQIISAPSLNAKIHSEGIIEGNFTADEVDRIVTLLNSGALPASLKPQPVSENTIGPTLGADTISKGTWSVLFAFAAVLVFMLIYYRFSGIVACIALLANLLLTVAFMVIVQATFTLPGLAGLVLMLGMAVDANVLIYERLREERDRGATLALAIRNGYDRAFPVILDTHLSSIFTAIVLYAVGNDQLKGFGISLTVGLVISLFTSLFMTRLMFDIWLAKGWLHKLSMMRLLSKPNFDFMAVRHYFFAGTIIVSVLGAALFFWRLDKGELDIDFVGGTAYSGQLVKPVGISTLRSLLTDEKRQEELLGGVTVRERGTAGRSFDITYRGETKPRRIELAESATVEDVRKRAERLPDPGVDQIFVRSNDPKVREGNKSAYFTVRTTEKSPELVQAAITRLLVEPDPEHPGQVKDLLKKIGMEPVSLDKPDQPVLHINAANTEAELNFVDLANGEPAFASPTEVHALLDREFRALDLDNLTQRFKLDGVGKQENGKFQRMALRLPQPLKHEDLTRVLVSLQKQFSDRPTPERLENFDKTLAGETQTRALYAILASWAAILLYLWFRFGNWTFGAAAVLCLIHDLCFTLGCIAVAHYLHMVPWLGPHLLLDDFKINLPTVAALLTLVGYSVNDTIVVFDRIREVRGKNPELTYKMINDSVNQTLSRTLLTAATVFLVVFVLYVLGGEGVHLFAYVMVVGVLVGTYSSIYIASPLLIVFGEGHRGAPVRERAPQPAGSA